jgi:polysaccharide biosynthesis protein PelG
MAGIGFALRTLWRQETLSGLVKASGHAAVIAAGPWLFTVFSLATIAALTEPVVGHQTLASFRAVIIYAFATSLVLASPVAIVATRLVADELWKGETAKIRSFLISGCALSIVSVTPGVAALVFYFSVPFRLGSALFATTATVAMIWVVLAFCGAVRDYKGITASFLTGLIVAIAGATAAALLGLGAGAMAWGFCAGLALTLAGLTLRVLNTFGPAEARPFAAVGSLLNGLKTYGDLAVGALFATAGVWVDKWVFWFSPEGQAVNGGLVHAPLYDSAMFIASLVIIPALAQFVMKLETEFFERYQHYYGTIRSHGTIDQIEAARVRLQGFSLENMVLITVSQLALAAVLVLAAPAIVDVLNLQFRQIAILRYGALGSVFLFIFIAATSMIVFFDRRRMYALLQVLFFTLNLVLTALSVRLGEDYYGTGYFAACVIASAVALIVAEQTFEKLNYLTFVGNNPSVTGRRRRWIGTWATGSRKPAADHVEQQT